VVNPILFKAAVANKSPQAELLGTILPRFATTSTGHHSNRLPPTEKRVAPSNKKLDRTSLELETQTCVVASSCSNKKGPESAVEMYEVTLQDQSTSAEKVRSTEGHLRQVSAQLKQAKKDLQVNREQIITDYEGRLEENISKLQYIQQQADQYRIERDKARQELELKKVEHGERKAKYKENLREARESARRGNALELQPRRGVSQGRTVGEKMASRDARGISQAGNTG
jgi:hypothetical protein